MWDWGLVLNYRRALCINDKWDQIFILDFIIVVSSIKKLSLVTKQLTSWHPAGRLSEGELEGINVHFG